MRGFKKLIINRTPLVQVSPVTPKHSILGIGKAYSDLSLSLIFPLRVEHLVIKVKQSLKNSKSYLIYTSNTMKKLIFAHYEQNVT